MNNTKKTQNDIKSKLLELAMAGNMAAVNSVYNSFDTRYKFRPVRGGFDEAMSELYKGYSGGDIIEHIVGILNINPVTLRSEYQCRDNRNGWNDDSWILLARFEDGEEYPVGYCNYEITREHINRYLSKKRYEADLKAGKICVRKN